MGKSIDKSCLGLRMLKFGETKIYRSFNHKIYCSYVHSDPHPGNILVHKNKNGGTDLILLDHGLYAVTLLVTSQTLQSHKFCVFQF